MARPGRRIAAWGVLAATVSIPFTYALGHALLALGWDRDAAGHVVTAVAQAMVGLAVAILLGTTTRRRVALTGAGTLLAVPGLLALGLFSVVLTTLAGVGRS